jgi:hypothetical protein
MGHKKQLPVYEPCQAPEMIFTSVERVTRLPGDLVEFVCCLEQVLEESGEKVMVVKLRAIWPLACLPAVMQQVAMAIANIPIVGDCGNVTMLS